MMSKRSIAIIGAGKKGGEIARRLAQESCRLIVMDRDPARVQDLLRNLAAEVPGIEILTNDCAKEACWEADVIILATPDEAEKEVADKIRQVAVGKVVLSTYNHHANELQKLLPWSIVTMVTGPGWAEKMTSQIFSKPQVRFNMNNSTLTK